MDYTEEEALDGESREGLKISATVLIIFVQQNEIFCIHTENDLIIKNALATDPHLVEHLSSFDGDFIPNEMLNYNLPFRTTDEFPDPSLKNFIPDTSEAKNTFDS